MSPSDSSQPVPAPVDLAMVRELKRHYPDTYFNAVRLGLASACYELGLAYLPGGRIPPNADHALYWLGLAAEKGHPLGCLAYGVLLSEGPGGHAAALTWYLQAARDGVAQAQYNLGVLYDNGYGVAPDKRQAFQWYLQAARNGYENAMCNVGVMYYGGDGVPADKREAFFWLKKAAYADSLTAQSNLATMYLSGDGAPLDHHKACYWFTKAAEGGDPFAQYHLAEMCYHGIGTQQNRAKARIWFRRAAAAGFVQAERALERLD